MLLLCPAALSDEYGVGVANHAAPSSTSRSLSQLTHEQWRHKDLAFSCFTQPELFFSVFSLGESKHIYR
jgi:hypothetical protein